MRIPFFSRTTSDSNVPEEVQEYYQAERRERVGVAWLLAGATLLATLLLAAGLFFGGKWAYNKIAHRNDEPTVSTTQSPEPAPTPTPNPNPTPTPSPSTETTTPNNTSAPTGTSSASTSTPSNAAVAPATTNQPSTIPNTGPDHDDE